MVLASWLSDRFKNRGWPTQSGWFLSIIGFGIYLGAPSTNHAARFAALIFAECGHYSMSSDIPSLLHLVADQNQ